MSHAHHAFVANDPWARKRPSWLRLSPMLEFSQKWVVLVVSLNFALIVWLGVSWTLNTMKLSGQDDRLTSLSDEVDWLRARVEWGDAFVRTRNAVNKATNGKMTPHQVTRLSEVLWTQSRTYGFDPLLIVAVMHVESRSNPAARGRFLSGTESGALGLMQLKLGTAQVMARSLGLSIRSEADLMKPEVNLMIGSYYLLRQIVRYGNVSKGLMAYNIGPYALESRLRRGERLPLGYSRKILVEYHRLTKIFGPPPL